MKILMVLEREFPSDVRVEKEIKTLLEAGHQIELACYTREGRVEREERNGYVVHRKPISSFIYKTSVGCLKFPFYFNFWRKYLSEILSQSSFDVIHIHDLPLAQVGMEMRTIFNLRSVLDLHENWPALLNVSAHIHTFWGRLLSSDRQWRKYERRYVSLMDRVVVVAQEMKDRLIAAGAKNMFFVVPNTVSVDIYEGIERNPDPDFITLFYAGGLNYYRGIQVAIEAMARLKKHSNLRFQIVGSGRHEEVLKQLTKQLQLEESVLFLGWKSQRKVYELLNQADIAIIPHLRNEHSDNTSPNKIFQYMLAGIPVVSSDCVYLKNIIEETGAGVYYQNTSSQDLADKIETLLGNAPLRKEMGQKGIEAVHEKYNWENTVTELVRLYREL